MELLYFNVMIVTAIIEMVVLIIYCYKKIKETKRKIAEFDRKTKKIIEIYDLLERDNAIFQADEEYVKWRKRVRRIIQEIFNSLSYKSQEKTSKLVEDNLYETLKEYESWRNQRLK